MITPSSLPADFSKAFKDADIRGVYPAEIDETVAYRVARAFVEEFQHTTVLVARDMRLSSSDLHDAFVAGVRDSGADVIDVGLVGTPALYYAAGRLSLPGVMITASHNPPEYNGLKLVQAGAIPLTRRTGLAAIKKRIKANSFTAITKRGSVRRKKLDREYTTYVRKQVPLSADRPLRVVIDAGNGMAATLATLLSEKLPLEVTPLFFELDGTFPNRGSNPTLAKNQKAIRTELRTGDYDFGIAFDGDADRVAFFDERGRYINSAVIGAGIAQKMLTEQPGAACVYTVFTNRAYEEIVRESGGRPIRARVGHAFIKNVMRKKEAIFACEHSAHFYFKENYYTDSGILAFLHVAAAYAAAQRSKPVTFSQFVKPWQRYYQTEEVLVRVADKRATLDAIVARYESRAPIAIERYDGVRITFSDHWLTVKPSVTEDALKFVVGAPKKADAKRAQTELKEFFDSRRTT